MRKIAVITGTRAEYGLLTGTMRELQALGAQVQLIVTGAHLSADHGMTIQQIEQDGWPIAATVDMRLTGDTAIDIVRSMSLATSGIGEALERLQPDIVVILGDRYEMLAAASAAAMLSIPIAHIHGGEVTEGAIDESIRHAITKLSYWHFPPYEKAAERIIRMGEHPSRVFTCGAPGIDNMVGLKLLSREAVEKEMGLALNVPVMLITYHPETHGSTTALEQVKQLIAALDRFPEATLLISGANADEGGRSINKAWWDYAAHRKNAVFRLSFGLLLYISAMKHCNVVVGNSSSGVLEAPVLGKATVNIGHRQTGRLRPESIIDCACETDAIAGRIMRVLSPEFQQTLKPSTLFGKPGEVAKTIAKKLCSLELPATLSKSFYEA